jgi:hypothetical protein
MALYRFLFAPALLAVALVAGSGERARTPAVSSGAPHPVRAALVGAEVSPVAAQHAAKPAARPVPRTERARAHPVR